MNIFSRLLYRVRQFRLAVLGPWPRVEDSALAVHLSPALMALFRRMRRSEQAHSWSVLERLQAEGHSDPDLLRAALLHDVGKVRAPLSVWERVVIVLGKKFCARHVKGWGEGEPGGLRRPFVVAAQHAAWGAELASAAGASPRTVELIRRHQEQSGQTDALLRALQAADDLE